MKKMAAIALSFAILLSLLAGCGAEPSERASNQEKKQAVPTEIAVAPTEAEPPAPASVEDMDSAVEPDAPAYEKVAYPLPLFDDQVEISLFYVLRGAQGGGYTPSKAITPPSADRDNRW